MAFERIPKGKLIMTPESPFFYDLLQRAVPPGWQTKVDSDFSGVFVCDSQTGMLKPASNDELEEYVEGGEYDEILSGQEECLLLT